MVEYETATSEWLLHYAISHVFFRHCVKCLCTIAMKEDFYHFGQAVIIGRECRYIHQGKALFPSVLLRYSFEYPSNIVRICFEQIRRSNGFVTAE
jgi:hypothetical protein